MTHPTPIVLDCDPGHDDAMALLLAVGSPRIDLRAVTTCFGNCSVEDASRNARQVLTLAGALDVPVARGAAGPLVGATHLGNYVHGASGLDGPPMPEPELFDDERGAVALLKDAIESSAQPVTIVVTGPSTNVATLLQEHSGITRNVAGIVFMGGSTDRGNHTPYAEFNVFADPEALNVILHSGLPVSMVGLNLTHQALATPEVVERIRSLQHHVGETAAAWMGFFGSSYQRVWKFDAPPLHDPCTVASLIEPALIEWVDSFVSVELNGEWTRGATSVDLFHRWPEKKPNVQVAMKLDVEGYWDLLIETIDGIGRRLS
jgi:pyrimidine-specific ribonucleoside hydrolase